MKKRERFILGGSASDSREAIRAYFLGKGFQETAAAEDRIALAKTASLVERLGTRIENLNTCIEVQVQPSAKIDLVESIVTLDFDIGARFRLLSRMDFIYFDLEVVDLVHYVETGARRDLSRRLDCVRRPVAVAVIVNTILSAALVAAIGTFAAVGPLTTISVAVAVGLINFVTIMGFAEVIVEGMEDVLEPSIKRSGSGEVRRV